MITILHDVITEVGVKDLDPLENLQVSISLIRNTGTDPCQKQMDDSYIGSQFLLEGGPYGPL